METKEKQRLTVRANYKPSFSAWRAANRDFEMLGSKFPWLFEISLMILGVKENFFSGLHTIGHEDCLHMSCCGYFFPWQMYFIIFRNMLLQQSTRHIYYIQIYFLISL